MQTKQLLVSNVNISEDDYNYKSIFTVSGGSTSLTLDLADLSLDSKVQELKTSFQLDEDLDVIRKTLTDMVIEKSHISSVIKEGEDYQESSKEKKIEKSAGSLDMA